MERGNRRGKQKGKGRSGSDVRHLKTLEKSRGWSRSGIPRLQLTLQLAIDCFILSISSGKPQSRSQRARRVPSSKAGGTTCCCE